MVEKLAKDNIKYERYGMFLSIPFNLCSLTTTTMYNSQLKKETYREFKDIINGPSNLAIIPTVTRDEVY